MPRFGLRSLRLMGLLTALSIPPAEAQGWEPGRDESAFQTACAAEARGCSYVRIWIDGNSGQSRLESITFKLSDLGWTRMREAGDIFWLHRLDCDAAGRLQVHAELTRPGGSILPIPVGRATSGTACSVFVRSADIEAAPGVALRIRTFQQDIGSSYGEVMGRVPFVSGMKTRLILVNNSGKAVHIDGIAIDGGLYRGPIMGGTIIDAPSSSSIVGDDLFYSTSPGWSHFAMEYGAREAMFLSGAPGREAIDSSASRLALIADLIADIKEKIKYRYEPVSHGPYPRRGVNAILESGFADCKDFAVLLNYRLREQGLESKSVITSLSSNAPPTLIAAGYWWVDHVVVWIPSENVFVDLTSPSGRGIVDASSAAYGHLGFEVETGQAVIIR